MAPVGLDSASEGGVVASLHLPGAESGWGPRGPQCQVAQAHPREEGPNGEPKGGFWADEGQNSQPRVGSSQLPGGCPLWSLAPFPCECEVALWDRQGWLGRVAMVMAGT